MLMMELNAVQVETGCLCGTPWKRRRRSTSPACLSMYLQVPLSLVGSSGDCSGYFLGFWVEVGISFVLELVPLNLLL